MPGAFPSQSGQEIRDRRAGKGRGRSVRVSEKTHAVLRSLAVETGEPFQNIVARAVEAYRRQRILVRTNAAYSALRSDPRLWKEELEEREVWDITIPG
ncbi:MAG TPA: hypothetical protein VFS96_01010 [Nitrolancea sp.]|nr:hypothetical protein [Nitrolancea sp.]